MSDNTRLICDNEVNKNIPNPNIYKYPIGLTQQFRMCGNPFRVDVYKGCTFGCKYCFANSNNFSSKNNFAIADFDVIEKYFYKAFETDKEYKNINIELLRHRVPLHLGGMSDPFQIAEYKYGLTYKLLELTNKYNYPMVISTKAAILTQKYYDVLNPDIHAFQISLCGIDEDWIRLFESNTPAPFQRINFIKKLKRMGFWVGVRIQPLINMKQAIGVVDAVSEYVDYITVEHLKISTNDKENRSFYFNMMDNDISHWYRAGKNYELDTEIKRKNVEALKLISSCPIGCGDNDLHELSDSYNCCGIDTIGGGQFDNWLKYNSMYINMTNDKSQWTPQCNCSSCFNSDCRKKGFGFKDYVDDFISKPLRKQQIHVKI